MEAETPPAARPLMIHRIEITTPTRERGISRHRTTDGETPVCGLPLAGEIRMRAPVRALSFDSVKHHLDCRLCLKTVLRDLLRRQRRVAEAAS